MKTNNKIPAYRFQGHTDAWELRKLGEVAEMYSGGTPSVGKKEFYEGNIPFIRSAEINSHNTELFLSELGLSNSSAKMVNEGDLLYALYGATSGEVGLAKISGAINQAILAIIPSIDYSSNFLLQWLKREKNNIIEKYLQGGQGNLSGAIVKDFSIMFPTLPEQSAIGTFFSTLDQQITLHQRKLDTLKEQKKTYLKLLFPSKGQTKPALRFQGFEDDWEEVKLGEVLSVSKLKNKENEYSKLDVLSVSREQGTVNQIEYQGRSFASDDVSGYKIVKVGQMIYTKSPLKGAPYGIFQTVTINGIVSPLYAVYNSSGRALASFVSLILKEDAIATHYLSPLVTKGAKNTINVTDEGALEGKVKIPSLPEQEAIGTFFQTLDQEIAQVEDKLASLKEMKKTLLRKLFV
ncbi:restriction endonuclease subunit S [Streptococcus suis]|nr:restriction endonuclease subunit S [Streptococcus suis]MBY5039109.1 restriction endonuclease subunit S [Streptococcus suis]